MNFRTAIRIDKLTEPIKHSDKVMLIGSCFSTNVGERLEEFEEAYIEQEINGEWYKVVTSPGVTAVRKTISPGETIKTCVHLNNAADLDKRMPDGKYRLVRKLYKDWSEGTTYYAVAEFEIESRSR